MTTLQSLRKLPQSDRASILAGVVQRLTPSPHAGETDVPASVRAAVDQAEQDLMKLLGVVSFDDAKDRAKALRFLSTAIREISMPASTIKNVRERVGDKGSLPLNLYNITFGEGWDKSSERLGVSKAEARLAVQTADGIQHFTNGEHSKEGVEATTLLVKHYFSRDPYTLIVIAGRSGATLRVDGAWKSFYSDVPSEPLAEPVQFLEAFVSVFGLPMEIHGTKRKLVVYESFPRLPGESKFQVHVDNLVEGERHPFVVRSTWQFGSYQMFVALAFAVDLTKYHACLNSHGVPVNQVWSGSSLSPFVSIDTSTSTVKR